VIRSALLLWLLLWASPGEAALSFAHGAIQWLAADIATTVYTVSGLSFQPKALRFSWMGLGSATDAGSNATHSRRGIGFATSTSDRRCVATQDQDNVGNAVATTGWREDAVAATVTSTPGFDGLLDLGSITSDGFTLVVDDAAPVDLTIFWEAWGGSDITVAATVAVAEPAGTGDQDYTVTGFASSDTEDQVVMFAGVQATAAAGTAARNDSGLTVGFASGGAAGENVLVLGNSDDGSANMDTDRYGLDGEALAMIAVAGGNPNARAQLTQFNTNGFRLNWIARGVTNRRYIALAVKGGAWRVGSFTSDDGTVGNTTTVSGLPFAPVGVSILSHLTTASTAGSSTTIDAMTWGIGSSSSSRRAMGHVSANSPTTSDINLRVEYDQLTAHADGSGNLLVALDLNAMNSDGFQVIVDVSDGAATRWYGYLTFGDAVVVTCPKLLTAIGAGC
jgi:hypothetical protein